MVDGLNQIKLDDDTSLQVVKDNKIIFKSSGKWLYPLFELESFLKTNNIDLSQALIIDKVIGKAAALMIIRLGAGRVHGHLMSELAVKVFVEADLPHSYNDIVKRINCQTELILENITDPDEAYRVIKNRAKIA